MISTGRCRWIFLILSLTTWITCTSSKEMRVVCYYTNWSIYRPGSAAFSPQNINPYLCTHLIYAFGGFTKDNTLKPFDKYQDIEKGGYAKFTGLKTYNKNLKTMLAIGGWNEGSTRFSPMVADAGRRKKLVKNVVKFLRQNHFDGLDLDWEYPTFRDGGKPRDRDNYAHLVQELREEFERESAKTGRPRLLLTMAVPAGLEYINKGYDVSKLTKYLDWMNILSYDYHSAFEPAVNHHAPLYPLEEDNEYNYDAELTIDHTIKHYLELGAEPNKLVLGIPTYGRSYTLFNPDAFEIGAPSDGPGTMGEATRENGFLSYYEICENIKSNDWEVEQPNPKAMGPYAFKDNQWVGYDDENIARVKAEYVAENGLGGIMFWSIDNDDFRGSCHGKPYPLIEAAKEALINAYGLTDDNLISPPSKPTKSRTRTRTKSTNKIQLRTSDVESSETKSEKPSSVQRRRNRFKSKATEDEPTETTKSTRRSNRRKEKKEEDEVTYSSLKVVTPSYTTPAPPSTPDLNGAFKCEDEGFFPHPKDCKKYFWCLSGAGDSGIVAHQFTCPAGLYFNKAADSCDYSQNVLCNKKLQKATTPTTSTTEASSPTTSTTTRSTKTKSSTIKFFQKPTTTSTTEAYEEEEYDDEDEDEEDAKSEEDPRVIKELIDLIRKAGGIEELEKQLKPSKDETSYSSGGSTTPSTISKALVEKVLSKSGRRNLYVPRNSRGPQNEGLSRTNSNTKSERAKLQYTSISRNRPSTPPASEVNGEQEIGKEVNEEEIKSRKASKSNQLEYVNIRRPRVGSSTEAFESDSRNRVLGETSFDEDDDDETETDDEEKEDDKAAKSTPQYVNIRRQRPSTTESPVSTSKYVELRRGTTSATQNEGESEATTSKYKTIRRGSTEAIETDADERNSSVQSSRGTTTPHTTANVLETSNRSVQSSRGTTTPHTTPNVLETSTRRYVNFRRGTTEKSTEDDEPGSKSQTPGVASETDEITAVSSKPESTEASSFSSTSSYISTTKDTSVDTLSSQDESVTKDESGDGITENNADIESNSVTDARVNNPIESQVTTTEKIVQKKRPQLFDPKPFSLRSTSARPITESTVKVSETTSRFRVRKKPEVGEKQNTPNQLSIRTRIASRLSADVNEKEDDVQETTTRRPRRRFSTTTTTERIIDDSRTYRTLEFSDLSSLTAVDFAKIKELSGNENNRRRRIRPVTSTTSATTTTTEELDESLRTGSRTLPVARKLISSSVFGNSRRLSNSGENSDLYLQTATTKKVRGFRVTREPSPTESTLELSTKPSIIVTPRNRRVIKRYRTTTTVATPESGSSNKIKQIDVDINLNRIDEGGYDNFDDSSTEEGENIKLSESNIRENSDVNSFRVDLKEETKLTKTKGFNAFDKSFNRALSPSTAEPPKDVTSEHSFRSRTRKIIRKVIPTEATVSTTETASATESNRKRKIIRRLRPANTIIKTDDEKNVDKKAVFTNSEITATDKEKADTDYRLFGNKFHLKATEDSSGHVESSEKATTLLGKEADEETGGFRKHLFRPKISIKSATPESTDPKKRIFKPTLSKPEDEQFDSQAKFLLRPKLTDNSETSNLPSRNRYFRPRVSKPRSEIVDKEEDSVTVPSVEIGNGEKAEDIKITVRPQLDSDNVPTRNRFLRRRLPNHGEEGEDNEQEVGQTGNVDAGKEKFHEEQASGQDDNFSSTASSVGPISQNVGSEQREGSKNVLEITTLNSEAVTDEEEYENEETIPTPAEDAVTLIPIASSNDITTKENAQSTERNYRRRPLRPISFVLQKTDDLPRSTTEEVPKSPTKSSLSDLRNKYIRYKSTERDNSNLRKVNRVYGFENEENLFVESPKNVSETTASTSQSSIVSSDNNAENIKDDISNIRQVNYTRLMSTISTETKDEMVDDHEESETEANYVGTTFSDQLDITQNAQSIPFEISTKEQEYADTKEDNDNEDDNESIKKFTKFSRTMTSKTSTSMETVYTYSFNSEDDDNDNRTENTSDFMDNIYRVTTETPMEDQSLTDTIRTDVAFTNAIPKTEMTSVTSAQEQTTTSAAVNDEENEITTIDENYPATEKLRDVTSKSDFASTPLDEMKTDTSTDETEPTLQEITTVATTTTSRKATTERFRSSFKPANARPKYSPKKLKDLSISSSTESSEVSLSQNRFRNRFKDVTKIENNKGSGLVYPKGNIFSTTERNTFRKINKLTSTTFGLTGYRFSSTTNKPINKFLYKYRSTENPDQEIEYDDEVYDVNEDNEEYVEDDGAENEEDVKDKEDEDTNEEENIAVAKVRSTSKPRPVNRPAFAKKQTTKVVNKPRLFTSTTIAPLTEDLSDIDQEAIKNRNKNLFSKARKMNTPFVASSTSSISAASSETATEAITTDSMKQETIEYFTTFPTVIQPETTESLTTLHHVFAEDITTSTPSGIRTETTSGKVERLVEVNRITKVETKENKIKNHMLEEVTVDKDDPVLDRVGEVNRITVIKIIDKEGNVIEKETVTENDIDNANRLSPVFIATDAKVEISSTTESVAKEKISFVEVAKVQEVPSKSVLGVVNLTNIVVEVNKSHIMDFLNTNREDRKIDLFPDINISRDTHKNEYHGKPDIIDGRSHINVITPRPVYNTEASTIALEALFRTESPGSNFNKNFVTLNDELLETEHSKFVNVRVLHPDESMRLDKGIKDKTKFIPIKLLKQDEEEITMKAQVVEVTPRSFAEMIKIIPIKVEMSKHLVNRLPYLKNVPPT